MVVIGLTLIYQINIISGRGATEAHHDLPDTPMASKYTPEEIEALKQKLWQRMDRLPQRDVIERSDASQWIDFVANYMPDEAMWHMVRAGGVGGSEIGILVRNYMGERADHGASAHDWALSKLLRLTPEPAHGVLQRGHDTEPIQAQMLYKSLGVRRDEAAFSKLSKAQGLRPWMRYSPDEVIWVDAPIKLMQGGEEITLQERILCDYKAPTQVSAQDAIAYQYMCQLHMGAVLCAEQGIELSGVMLCQLDWATWSLKKDFMKVMPEMCDLILEAGTFYWDEMLQGRVPAYVVRNRMDVEALHDEKCLDLVNKVAMVRAMAKRLEKASDQYSAELMEMLGVQALRFDGQKIVFPHTLSVSAPTKIDEKAVMEALPEEVYKQVLVKGKKVEYDTAALVRAMKERQIDVKPYRVAGKLDPSLTFAALQSEGHDPEEFVIEVPRITVAHEVSEQAEQWFSENFTDTEPTEQGEAEEEEEPVRETARPTGG